MIIVDTGAWFAAVVPDDPDHDAVARLLRESSAPLLLTDYILDETLTLLRARGENRRALVLGAAILEGSGPHLHHVSPDEVIAAWDVFQRFSDKGWSFTDCTSKVVMERLGITEAFSLDHHFHQFGFLRVYP